jgi:Carboxypeptidase regulatory-like domain
MALLAIFFSIAFLLQGPATPKSSIEGVIITAGSGQPVPGARVTATRRGQQQLSPPQAGAIEFPGSLQSPPAPAASTDANGKFIFQSLDEGSYTLRVEGNGYIPQVYGQRYPDGPGTPIALAPGQGLKDLSIALMPAGNISGRVRDTDGQPLVDCPVQLLKYSYNATGSRIYQSVGTVRTNDRGEYRLYWVTAGRYYMRAGSPDVADPLFAMVPGIMSATKAAGNPVPAAAGTAFYPGVADLQDAQPIDLQAGGELHGVDVVVPSKPKTYKVRGRITDSSTGQPPSSVVVGAQLQTPISDPGGLATILDLGIPNRHYNPQTGTFELGNLTPGAYVVKATVMQTATGGPPLSGSTTVRIADSDIDGVGISMFPAVAIEGRLQVEGQLPQGASIERLALVFITPSDGGHGDSVFVRSKIKADGTFHLAEVLPGAYRFRLQPDLGTFIKEARFNGLDILNSPFQFPGGAGGIIDIVVASNGGRISGAVTDGRSQFVPGMRVVLVPDRMRERTELFKSVPADENGEFTFSNVPPGDYKVFAWEQIDEYLWYDPEVLAQSETKGKAVHVTQVSAETIEVNLIPAGGGK